MLDRFIIIAYFVITIFVSKFAGARNTKEYLSIKRKYSLTTLTAAMFASAVGASTILAISDKFYEHGVKFFLMLSGNYLSQAIIGLFVITKMKRWIGCFTPADIIADIFSPKLKFYCGISTAFVSAGFVAIQFHALGKVLHYFFGFKAEYFIIICAMICTIYNAMRGLNAIVRTELFQSCVIIVGIIFLAKMGVMSIGGIKTLFTVLPSNKLDLDLINPYGINFFLSAILVGFNPSFLQRVFVAKNINQARDATLMYNFLVIILFIVLGLCGLVAFVHNPNLKTMIIPYLANLILPDGIKGLVIAAILAAIMSTADSDLNIASVSLYKDVLKYKKKDRDLSISILTCVIGIVAAIIAISFNEILDILFFVVDFWAVTFMFPLIFGIIGIKINYKKIYYVIMISIITMISYEIFVQNKLLNSNIIGSLTNVIIYIICHIYERYRRKNVFFKKVT